MNSENPLLGKVVAYYSSHFLIMNSGEAIHQFARIPTRSHVFERGKMYLNSCITITSTG
jgi:hypothetical protein